MNGRFMKIAIITMYILCGIFLIVSLILKNTSNAIGFIGAAFFNNEARIAYSEKTKLRGGAIRTFLLLRDKRDVYRIITFSMAVIMFLASVCFWN